MTTISKWERYALDYAEYLNIEYDINNQNPVDFLAEEINNIVAINGGVWWLNDIENEIIDELKKEGVNVL